MQAVPGSESAAGKLPYDIPESTPMPSGTANYAKIRAKDDGTGTTELVCVFENSEQIVARDSGGSTFLHEKSYSIKPPSGTGSFYIAGYYEAPAADANLNQGSTTQVYGSANHSYAAHAFAVVGGAGTASGGAGAVVLTVSGTSITDAGVRTPGDSETIIADITAVALNEYYESAKKWIGQITFTLDVGATGHTAYALDFNYGWCKYDDRINTNFILQSIECVGLAGANDSGFNIELLHHKATGWVYSAAAFSPGVTIFDMNTDHGTEQNLVSGEYFAWKRGNLATSVAGAASEGFLVRLVVGANNAVAFMDMHIGTE